MTAPTHHPIRRAVAEYCGGSVSAGPHDPAAGAACILEAVSVAMGVSFTDDPAVLRWPDLRGLNDAYRSDTARTAAMTRLAVALWGWEGWPKVQRLAWYRDVVYALAHTVLPPMLAAMGIDPEPCRTAQGLAQTARAVADAEHAARVAGSHATAISAAYVRRAVEDVMYGTSRHAVLRALTAMAYTDADRDRMVDILVQCADTVKNRRGRTREP